MLLRKLENGRVINLDQIVEISDSDVTNNMYFSLYMSNGRVVQISESDLKMILAYLIQD